jgi:hypothetical protein
MTDVLLDDEDRFGWVAAPQLIASGLGLSGLLAMIACRGARALAVLLCKTVRKRRAAIKHAQDIVATQIRRFEQHAVNSCFAVGREYGLVCRCIEYRN